MSIIGEAVKHKTFGKGIIAEVKGKIVTVKFYSNDAKKLFEFPDAFEKFLQFEDINLQKEALSALNEKRIKKIEAQKSIHYEQPSSSRTEVVKKKTKKLPPRKNLAFKLNFCDGGASLDSIGFKSVCSDEVIRYNIVTAKRRWCSFENCPCRKFLDGLISREELDNSFWNDFTCYESYTFLKWIAHAGTTLNGIGAGKPRKLPNAQHGSLAILTTRYPNSEEKDRVIVGVFIIDSTFKGNDVEPGTVSATSDYKIEIRPDEVQKLKYWNYNRNEGNPSSKKWGTGLYRFVKDEDAIRLLEDIVNIKKDKNDYRLAVSILEHFKELHEL